MEKFKKVFGINGKINNNQNPQKIKTNNLESELLEEDDRKYFPKESDFVDLKPPKPTSQLDEIDEVSPIKSLLLKDWYCLGYNEGYKTSCKSNKDNAIKVIVLDLILALKKHKEKIEIQKYDLNNQLLDIDNDDNFITLRDKLKLKINLINDEITKLDQMGQELEEHKGVLSAPIHKYIEGYTSGASDKINFDLLSKSINSNF